MKSLYVINNSLYQSYHLPHQSLATLKLCHRKIFLFYFKIPTNKFIQANCFTSCWYQPAFTLPTSLAFTVPEPASPSDAFSLLLFVLENSQKAKKRHNPYLTHQTTQHAQQRCYSSKKLYSDCIQNRSRSQRSNRTKSRLMNPPCGNHEIRSTNLAKSILTNKDFLSLPLLLKSFVLLCEKDKLYSFQVKLFTDYHNLFPIPTSY